jgi:DNA-binding XRE family transcriptional regulator
MTTSQKRGLKPTKQERTLKLIERLIEMSAADPKIRSRAMRMHSRIKLPMAKVLERVPGESIIDKAKTLGISRQTWYVWQSGATRPNLAKARQLERITGYTVAEIRGVEDEPQVAPP